MTPLPQITLSIPSRLEHVQLLGHAVESICRHSRLSPSEAHDVELCVVEAANNSIEHAYRNEPMHTVVVAVDVQPKTLILEIIDSGYPANTSEIQRDRTKLLDFDPADLDAIPERGRGLAIIQKLMDSVEYIAGAEWNRLRLTKRLDSH
jgi:serine/threonine-protein kinase RsbW